MMLFYVIMALIVMICAFILSVYGYLTYMKFRQRRLWDELYAQLKIKYGFVTDMLDIVKDIYPHESEALKILAGCLNAFISSRTPLETAAAYTKTQTALHGLDVLLDKYPLVRSRDAYVSLKDEMISVDEKIAFASQFYNDSAGAFNARLSKLPFKAVAGIFNIGAKGRLEFKRQ